MPNLQSCAHPPSEQHSQIVLPPRFELGLPPWKGGDLPLVYRSIKPNSYAVWYYVWLITEHSHQSVQITLTFDKITALLWNYPMVCHLSLCIRRSRHLRGSGFLILPTNTNPFSPAVIYVPCNILQVIAGMVLCQKKMFVHFPQAIQTLFVLRLSSCLNCSLKLIIFVLLGSLE